MKQISRRDLLKIGGMGATGLLLTGWQKKGAPADPNTVIVHMENSYVTGRWYFEPAGIYIQKGQKVRWESTKTGASVTAFHPSNQNHELRIPENAKPFDSGLMGDFENNVFEYTFEVEGTYDYFRRMHEPLGMVGRIIVGAPGGPGDKSPGYGGAEGRAVVFPGEVNAFQALSPKQIMDKKTLSLPKDLNLRAWPYSDS